MMRLYQAQNRAYCGVDLHARTMYVCVLDPSGRTLLHRDLPATPEAFLTAIAPHPNGLVVACECMFAWYWLADLCHAQHIPFVLGHALEMRAIHGTKTKNDRTRCRRLPGWFLVWFVIALGLFCRDCYRQDFRWLQPFRPGAIPPRSTFCEARQRLGVAPMPRLAEQVIRLQGQSTTPGAFYRGMRTMALDGFVVDRPDTPANERAFGRPGSGRAPGAFPQARVLALCETGSHVLWRSLIKPYQCGEVTMAHYLLRSLQPNMLVLWDRSFLSYQTVAEVRQRRAHLLARIKSNLIFEPIRILEDGSYLAKLYRSAADRRKDCDGILVRIIEYTFDDPGRPGSGERHRLLTTLWDETLDPARTLIVLYHERWEEELTIDELKTHQRERPVLRSVSFRWACNMRSLGVGPGAWPGDVGRYSMDVAGTRRALGGGRRQRFSG